MDLCETILYNISFYFDLFGFLFTVTLCHLKTLAICMPIDRTLHSEKPSQKSVHYTPTPEQGPFSL